MVGCDEVRDVVCGGVWHPAAKSNRGCGHDGGGFNSSNNNDDAGGGGGSQLQSRSSNYWLLWLYSVEIIVRTRTTLYGLTIVIHRPHDCMTIYIYVLMK